MTEPKTLDQLAEEMGNAHPDAILVTEDSGMVGVNLPDDPAHFAEYAAAVLRCSLVEHVQITPGLHLWLDEEGLGERPQNLFVTWFSQNCPGSREVAVHGPVLITGHHEDRVMPLEAAEYLRVALAHSPLPAA